MNTLNIIGCGKVGKTLGYLLVKSKLHTIQNILNRSSESALIAKEFIGEGFPITSISELTPADIYLITVPDDCIADIVEKLMQLSTLKPNALVIHCSGALSADILRPLKTKFNVRIASVHPVKAFGNPNQDIHDFAGVFCCIEGDELAVSEATALFENIGAEVLSISPENKILYHSALVFSSNFIEGLIEMSFLIFNKIGIDKSLAKQILKPIVTKLLTDKLSPNSKSVLTGPFARGDVAIIDQEIQKLAECSSIGAACYRLLGKLLLSQTVPNIPEGSLKDLKELLEEPFV